MRSKQANPSSRSFARRKKKTEALVCYGLFSRKVCYQRHPKKRSQWALSQLCSNSFGSEQKSCIKDDIFTPPILFHLDLDLFQGAWKPNFHIIINYHTFPAFAGTLKPIDACTSPCNCCKCELADLNLKGWQKSLRPNVHLIEAKPMLGYRIPDTKTSGLNRGKQSTTLNVLELLWLKWIHAKSVSFVSPIFPYATMLLIHTLSKRKKFNPKCSRVFNCIHHPLGI